MYVGKNLAQIISSLNMTNRVAAEKIGISYNTLSNIINGHFLPSEETIEKIKLFVEERGKDASLLFKTEPSVCNFRLRVTAGLSGNEKAALRNTVQKIERLLIILHKLEQKSFPLYNYFDIYALPYEGNALFDAVQRRSEFQKAFQMKKRTPEQCAQSFINPANKEFWGNLYYDIFPESPQAFHILYLVECLGIQLRFMPFGTEKAESCSTSLVKGLVHNAVWANPSIIINTDICDTTEKCLSAMAKEFFKMIALQDEYGMPSTADFQIESPKTKAESECFAKELLLSEQKIKSYLEQQKLKTVSAWDISHMKRQFAVGHGPLIDRLSELSLCDMSKQEYVAALGRHYDGIGKIPFLNSEPEPLPISCRGGDFFECAVLAALERGLLTIKESAEYLGCTEEDIKRKMKENRSKIDMILER